MKNKRGIISEYLPWILISLAVLVVLVLTAFLLREKGFSIIGKIGGLLKGR